MEKNTDNGNIIPQLCQILGIEIEQEFKIEESENTISKDIYKFTKNTLQCRDEKTDYTDAEDYVLARLIEGIYKIHIPDFMPKEGEKFYTYNKNWDVTGFILDKETASLLYWKQCGIIFPSKASAKAKLKQSYEFLTNQKYFEPGSQEKKEPVEPNGLIGPFSKSLGVELFQEFTLKDKNVPVKEKTNDENTENSSKTPNHIYRFTYKSLETKNDQNVFETAPESVFQNITTGQLIVDQRQYLPKKGDKFYTYTENWETAAFILGEKNIDYLCRLKCGAIFQTKEEADKQKNYIYKLLTGKELKKTEQSAQNRKKED